MKHSRTTGPAVLSIILFLVQCGWAQKTTSPDECSCETAPLPDALVVVNGTRLKAVDVFSAETQKKISALQQSVVDERKNELQLLINSRLLEDEARKRGVTVTRLVKEEVTEKVSDPTDTQIEEFYNRNRANLTGDLASSRNEITAYIRNKRETARAEEFAAKLRSAATIKTLVEAATPPSNAADRSRVFAYVNGFAIRSADVEDMLRPVIFSVQEEVYRLRNNDIEVKVNEMLLAAEAQKRKMTESALMNAEVAAKVPAVTDADARMFYNQNKELINGDFEKVRMQLIDYLGDKKKTEAEAAFAKRLRAGANVQVFLPAPVPPTYQIDLAGKLFKGDPGARVTIVEFIDVECRTCAEPYAVVDRVVAEMNGKVRLAVLHFPLTQHKHAQKAAEAAEAARDQGKFWQYLDLLFKNQKALELADLKQYATQLGLDRKKFDAALDGTRLADIVEHDRLEGDKIGVNRTPTVFINGRRSFDITYEGIKGTVEAAIKSGRQ